MALVGMNGRFFPNNWRPAAEEVAFAQQQGFAAIQFPGKAEGLGEDDLGSSLSEVAERLGEAGIGATMEQLILVGANGKTKDGQTPFDFMTANLEAIKTLRCSHVHWHLAPARDLSEREARDLEQHLLADIKRAADLADASGFRFGIEPNEPKRHLIASPESCSRILERVPNAGLVWDFNHTAGEQVDGFKRLGDPAEPQRPSASRRRQPRLYRFLRVSFGHRLFRTGDPRSRRAASFGRVQPGHGRGVGRVGTAVKGGDEPRCIRRVGRPSGGRLPARACLRNL